MLHSEDKNLLKYWRNTLADASRVEIQVDKLIHQYQVSMDYARGTIDEKHVLLLIEAEEKRVNEMKGRSDRKDQDWEQINDVSILIAPFSISPDPEYTKYSGETGIFYPFWIRAVLKRAGNIIPYEDNFPYIPRIHLEPQVNDAVNFIFSDVDKVDAAFAKPFAGENNWVAYWKYIQHCFKNITGADLFEYTSEGHTTKYTNTVVISDNLTGAADAIIGLYDYLNNEKETLPLLKEFISKGYTPLRPLLTNEDLEQQSSTHLGQMAYEYPLSISQRKSLYHFLGLKRGELLAVNGPPGTGKTTLLQSVVANEVVQSAINGGNPPVILACSTNNQAVTNIIDSFSSVKQKPGLLYQRWLPDVKGFGLYLPSQAKAVAKDIPYIKRTGGILSGAHTEKENSNYLATAEMQFLANFEAYSGVKDLSISAIADQIRSHLIEKQAALQEGIRLWKQYKRIHGLLQELSPGAETDLFKNQHLEENKLDQMEAAIKLLESRVSDYLETESFWIKLFSFFRFIKEKRAVRLKQIFRDSPIEYTSIDFYRIPAISHFFDEKLKLINQIRMYSQAWNAWKQKNNIESNPPIDDTEFKAADRNKQSFFYDELEMGLKYDLFYLATHYWEGRWLLATEELVREDRTRKNGRVDAQQRWQRFAMLTPCFVSTFYMAPKFFTYSKLNKISIAKSVWETPPLLDFIDLLIVDEAGQVSPEVGAATFALAKKAIIVGDTLQIEPVWNVPLKVDYANLIRYKVANSIENTNIVDDLDTKGFLSSSGSIMKMAQKASAYHAYPTMERGMMLTEHRRCFDEIIGYCNKLAYNGLLEPKKGPARNTLFPPMQFIDSKSNSTTNGKSRSNTEEAICIAQWILTHQQQLIRHYQWIEDDAAGKEKRTPRQLHLADIIGIVTPFTGQKYELMKACKSKGIPVAGLTIGTVHALQGAERPIVLFSATYGLNDVDKGYFFDRGVNMLNVAVSRAKDAFILFGCSAIFKRGGNTPSMQLYNYIKSKTNIHN
ncbi:AAA domain-containing protein [Chitinophaga sp. S165]|uniref:AAA domain-containing protein n=1 Tax=Chitinophaga sp. S165 TaxID=2135462 RepID=UPI000D70CE45|nr:AAA domain-containing protein [Chitinophaga sp. S165]PWV49576.1 AAA domain-containing protein [Chitinophaga sp. S165]